MFNRFFKSSKNFLHKNKKDIESAVCVAGAVSYLYHYPALVENAAQNHVRMYKARLSEDERQLIECDPEKSKEHLDECIRQLRVSMRPD